jgi:site-specific recombinase XerD
MHKNPIVSDVNSKADVTFQSFEDYLEQFRRSLIDHNYANGTISPHIRCLNVLAEAMKAKAITLEELDETLAVEIIAKTGWMRDRSTYRALIVKRFVRFLVERGVAKAPCPPTAKEAARDELHRGYSVYLRRQRGLSERSVARLWHSAGKFLDFRFGEDAEELSKIMSVDVAAFLKHQTIQTPSVRDKTLSSNLRSFFQYLFQTGIITHNLASFIPSVAQRYAARLPRHLSTEQVELLLNDIRQDGPRCKRNYAMVLLLARLGMRPQEVIAIQLDDIDWRTGEITVRGKGSRHDRLPIPEDVGKAIADYIRSDRVTTSRALFVCERPPHRPFKDAQILNSVLNNAYARTGLKPPSRYVGAQVLRHSLATNLVRRGASLEEIGDILRHRSRATTMIYAKLDVEGLRSIAQSWPIEGGAN